MIAEAAATTCLHCRGDIAPGCAVTTEEREAFCCRGCLTAWLFIRGAGLGDFYRRRDRRELWLLPQESSFSAAVLERYLRRTPEGACLDLQVEGIRCASCVWLCEKILSGVPGVVSARVNYATHRARVIFREREAAPAELLARLARVGYRPRPYTPSAAEEARGAERRDLLLRFAVAAFLSMQLMASSVGLYAGYFQGIESGIRGVLQYLSWLLATPVVFWSGLPFLRGAWRGLRHGAAGMDLLVAAGALSSYGYSVCALFAGGEVYFETAAGIVTLILVGRLLEAALRERSGASLASLAASIPAAAILVRDGTRTEVQAEELAPGDLVLVPAGEPFPADGTIVEGESEADEAAATGEALPVAKAVGDAVLGGTRNLTGSLLVRVERAVPESFVSTVARAAEEAQARRAPVQRLADAVSAAFVPAVMIVAGVVVAVKVAAGAVLSAAVMTGIAVVIIACPCALGLATPAAVTAAAGAAARRGILFRGADVIERLAAIRTVALDKTGTVTLGMPEVVEVLPAPGWTAERLLALCAALEGGSTHPVARGIVACAAASSVAAPPVQAVAEPGKGVRGAVKGAEARVGSEAFLAAAGTPVPLSFHGVHGVVHASSNGVYVGTLQLRDRLRGEGREVVESFRQRGVRTLLLSGDRSGTVAAAAAELGVDEWHADLLPAGKAELVAERELAGGLLYVGDGLNDAPPLARASVGCAVCGGSDLAVDSADIVLTRPGLSGVREAYVLAVRTMRVVRQNLAWALVYNVVAIPLAVTGRLSPVHAAAAMAASSLCVLGNSLRLAGRAR